MSLFVLKLVHNDDIRRASVDTTTVTYKSVNDIVQQYFRTTASQAATLRYIDEDGDTITIGSDPELHEAIALAVSSGRSTLRLIVEFQNSDNSKSLPTNPSSSASTASVNNNDDESNTSSKPDEKKAEPTNDSASELPPMLQQLLQSLGPQATVFIDQLTSSPDVKQAAENFGIDLSNPDPSNLIKQVLDNPLLRDLLQSSEDDKASSPFAQMFAAGDGTSPFTQLFEAANANNSNDNSDASAEQQQQQRQPHAHPLAALFAAGGGLPAFVPPHIAAMLAQARCASASSASANANDNNNDKDNNDSNTARHNAICDACNKHIVGIRWKCTGCPDYDLCDSCEPRRRQVHNPNHLFLKIDRPVAPNQQSRRTACCSGNGGAQRWRERCAQMRAYREAQAKAAAAQMQAEQAQAQARASEQPAEKQVELVGHETIELGTPVAANSNFVKVWRVKNCSSKAWPAGCTARFISGDRVGDFRALVGYGDVVEPGQWASVALDCTAPRFEGALRGTYAIVDADNRPLVGDKLPIEVVVV